jgi:hypothetical protein
MHFETTKAIKIKIHFEVKRNWESLVGIVTGWTARVRFTVRGK